MIDFMKKISLEAGEICMNHSATISAEDLSFKGKRDLVTQVDKDVEQHIVSAIDEAFSSHDVIGEESGSKCLGSKHRWIIDPIDGTTSYFHRQPYFSISIAYQYNERTVAGIVYAPALGQMFSAEKGKGAYLNDDTRLRVSDTGQMINSVLATGFACLRAGRRPNNLIYLEKILPEIRDIRRCGSAALDLAYVAAAKVDGFWEMDLNLYDIAAGVLLVEEAGGEVTDMNGNGDYPKNGIVATNGLLHDALLSHYKQ